MHRIESPAPSINVPLAELYKKIREIAAVLADVPKGEVAEVDNAFQMLHAAYWTECPEPAESAFPTQPDAADYRVRVRRERAKLNVDVLKLFAFTGSDTFRTIDSFEQGRLVRQLNAMRDYLAVLDERIANFN